MLHSNLAKKCAQFTEKEECVNQKNLETVSPFQQDNEYWYFTKKNKEDIKNAKCQGCTNYVSACNFRKLQQFVSFDSRIENSDCSAQEILVSCELSSS